MATFTVADASYTHHDAIGNNVSIPDRDLDIDLPGDAEVGDLIVMGFAPLVGRGLVGALVDAPDYSLVPGGSSDPTTNGVGAYGVTSDLSSVTVTARYGWGVDAMVVALRDVVSGPISTTSIAAFTVEDDAESEYYPPLTDDLYTLTNPSYGGHTGVNAGIVFLFDLTRNDLLTQEHYGLDGVMSIGEAADWDSQVYYDELDGLYAFGMKAFTHVGGGSLPAMFPDPGVDTAERFLLVLTFADAGTTRPYLRQRQSPLWVPSRNSTTYSLRNRQTPYL